MTDKNAEPTDAPIELNPYERLSDALADIEAAAPETTSAPLQAAREALREIETAISPDVLAVLTKWSRLHATSRAFAAGQLTPEVHNFEINAAKYLDNYESTGWRARILPQRRAIEALRVLGYLVFVLASRASEEAEDVITKLYGTPDDARLDAEAAARMYTYKASVQVSVPGGMAWRAETPGTETPPVDPNGEGQR